MAENYKGMPVFQRRLPGARSKESYYVKATMYCHCCGKAIPGTKAVSRGKTGGFSCLQTFVPDDKAAHTASARGRRWNCGSEKCNAANSKEEVKKPQPLTQPAPALEHQERHPVFTQQGDDFFYRGFKIEGNTVRCEYPCRKCGKPIIAKYTVTYKDGKPHGTGGARISGPSGKPIQRGSLVWEHDECPPEISSYAKAGGAPLESAAPANDDGVHATHCCATHGCKFGDEDCPVVAGRITGIACEECHEEELGREAVCHFCGKVDHWRPDCPVAAKEYDAMAAPTSEVLKITRENEELKAQVEALKQEAANALEFALDLESQLNAAKEELAAVQIQLAEIARKPPVVGLHPPVTSKPQKKMEQMALDPNISDKAVRGATWILMRAMQGRR